MISFGWGSRSTDVQASVSMSLCVQIQSLMLEFKA